MLQFIRSSYFTSLLEGLGSGVLILNTAGRVYAANRMAETILGHGEAELLHPDTWPRLVAATDLPAGLEDLVTRAAQGHTPQGTLDLRYAHPDGQRRHLKLNCALLEQYGKIFGILLDFTDITEVVLLHQRQTSHLQERNRAQEEHIQGLLKFSEAVAHQIRNPTMAIGGFANYLLRKRPADDPERGHLERIIAGSRRLLDVVEAVAAFRALPAARPRPVALDEDLALLVQELEGMALGQHAGARLVFEPTPTRVVSDPGIIGLILRELVRNAVEHLPAQGGRVVLALERVGTETRLSVADDGPGIPEESLPYVWDPFFTDKAVGVGMGLTKVMRLAQELGARLEMTNREPRGLRVALYLP